MKTLLCKRGFGNLIVWVILGIGSIFGYAELKGFSLFHPSTPDVGGLTVDQKKLADLQSQLDVQKAEQAAALAAAQAAKDAQVKEGQQMVTGVGSALKNVPPSSATILAVGLNTRAQVALASAVGNLPLDKQKEINGIVEEALSQSAAQIADAQAKLAAKDVELQNTTAARTAAETKVSQLSVVVAQTTASTSAAQVALTDKTNEVKSWVQKKIDSDSKGNIFSNEVDNLVKWGILIGIIYIVVHWVLPSLAAQFPACRLLVWIYNLLTSLTSAHTISVPSAPVISPK